MSFTKVAPAGIGTEPGTSILIGDSLLHSTGIDIGSNTGIGVTIRKHGDATFTGIVTAASFSGSGANLTGIDATAIKHTDGNVKVQATGTGANLTGNLSVSGNLGVGGVLTYEDVTNIDSVGVITARGGIKIGPTAGVAATIFSDGSINTTGIVTATTIKVGTAISITDSAVSATRFHGDGSQLTGIDASALSSGGSVKVQANSHGAVTTGVHTATSFSGSGANLTNLPGSTPPNNFLINGAMQVNVRGTNHQTLGSFNPVTSAIYTLDRWKVLNSNSFDTDSAKVVQDNGAPTSEGFRKSIMMNIGNTETPSSTQVCGFQQKIEAQNLQSLAYGTSSAKTMTLTFWVYSNKTGTYCVQIMQDDVNKYVLYEYTISSSNTWEKKTITVAGNTSNAINNDTGIGLEVNWILCVGSGRQASATSSWTSGGYYVATSNQVNLWDHADNYFKMTGCQLQIGSATDFIHEDIGTTLRKCQRYFYMACGPDGGGYETIGTGMIYYSGTGYANVYFPTTMRTQPSIVALSGSSGAYMYQTLLSNTAAYTHQIAIDTGKTSLNGATVSCACPSSRAGEAFRLSAHFAHEANGGQSFVNFDAEL